MPFIFDMPEYTETVHISDIRWLTYTQAFVAKLKSHNIKTIYIAPKEELPAYQKYIYDLRKYINVEVTPFAGGFKSNSVTLFPLKTKDDLLYFSHVTDLRLSKYGELI